MIKINPKEREKSITFQCSKELHKKIKLKATWNNKKLSDYIRELVEKDVESGLNH